MAPRPPTKSAPVLVESFAKPTACPPKISVNGTGSMERCESKMNIFQNVSRLLT